MSKWKYRYRYYLMEPGTRYHIPVLRTSYLTGTRYQVPLVRMRSTRLVGCVVLAIVMTHFDFPSSLPRPLVNMPLYMYDINHQ